MSTCVRALLLLLIALAALAGRAADISLAISGEIKQPQRLSLSEIKSLGVISLKAKDHNGETATYEGVPVAAILARAGVPQGEALRGEALQLGVLAKASDGYQALFALAELDPKMSDKQVLLAFRRNGADLQAPAGPLRLVVPDEKRQARWVRQVIELEIVRVGKAATATSNRTEKHP